MIKEIFNWNANIFIWLSKKTHLSYNAVNIIVYYMLVPLTWAMMLDFVLHCWPVLTIIWLTFCLFVSCIHRHHVESFCDMIFKRSVEFLMWFQHVGWDYYKASVIICVMVIALIYLVLIGLLII